MNTRGLTELVMLTIGLSLGVISDRTFAMMVLMALVTTFMAAPIIHRLMPRREMVRVLSGGDPAPMAYRILVALGNPANARALVDAGIRAAGLRRPAELLLVRLIPTPRAPEFRSGLRDVETQIDRSTADMDQLARRATEAGVSARSISFLSESVGRDLSDVAASQRCDAMLLGWHRASLARDVVRALVHRVLKVAKCDVLVFVDRKGDGITGVPGATAPVVAAITSEEDAASVSEIAQRLADNLGTTVQRMSGHDVVPDVVAASHEAPVAVVAVGHMMEEESDFGAVPTGLAAQAECPVLVVRPSSLHVSIIPGMTPASSRQAVRA
jgi:nucleotide-binding universal stress UspA family protein